MQEAVTGQDACLLQRQRCTTAIGDLALCPETSIPEAVPTAGSLGSNRWALVDDDPIFDQGPPQKPDGLTFTTQDTGGCSCEQIIEILGLGNGHSKFGCSTGIMRRWTKAVSWESVQMKASERLKKPADQSTPPPSERIWQ